jgi:hypothetical protein
MVISLAEEMGVNPSDPATIKLVASATVRKFLTPSMLYLSNLIVDFD